VLTFATFVVKVDEKCLEMERLIMHTSELENILGGEGVLAHRIKSSFDLIDLSKRGLSKASLEHLSIFTGISVNKLVLFLPISFRSVQRLDRDERFSSAVSEGILRIAEVFAKGMDVFEDRELLMAWMSTPSPALNRKTPLDLLDTLYGAQVILDELTRIEHGVAA
jgi:putative toxin-antitoxin system antitoxin component (TIGR02293 family)